MHLPFGPHHLIFGVRRLAAAFAVTPQSQPCRSERSEDLRPIARFWCDESPLLYHASCRSENQRPLTQRVIPTAATGLFPRAASWRARLWNGGIMATCKRLLVSIEPSPSRLLLLRCAPQMLLAPSRFHVRYIVLRHIPRTRPSGVTINLSSWPNTGDYGVLGGHA
jgi:hypothetical protein